MLTTDNLTTHMVTINVNSTILRDIYFTKSNATFQQSECFVISYLQPCKYPTTMPSQAETGDRSKERNEPKYTRFSLHPLSNLYLVQ